MTRKFELYERRLITAIPLRKVSTRIVSAIAKNRAMRTSEVQDPETDTGQHCVSHGFDLRISGLAEG
jgi:hypothetical protein